MRCSYLLGLLACAAGLARAQDPFEIHVYEYETLHPGQFTLEAHLNYVGTGTKDYQGPVAPFQDQFHLTVELTAGLTNQVSIGFMQLNARRPDHSLEYAGWRVLPHFYVPESWHWPFQAGLVTEFSFQKTTYEENSRRVEIRPILEKTFTSFKPTSTRYSLVPCTAQEHRPDGTSSRPRAWRTKPPSDSRRAWNTTPNWATCRRSFRSTNRSTRSFLAATSSSRKTSCGASASESAQTPAGNRIVYKSRFEFSFGRDQ
jgi:hypothetical protein